MAADNDENQNTGDWMKFEEAELLSGEFEDVLKNIGLDIPNGSMLEDLLLDVKSIFDHYKKINCIADEKKLVRIMSRAMGIVDIVYKVVKNKDHKCFGQIKEHLEMLCKIENSPVNGITQNTHSPSTDQSTNKLFELYIALCCMAIDKENIMVDSPFSAKGDNPDVIFSYNGKRIGIACKAVHSSKLATNFDRILEGYQQIENAEVEDGFVFLNYKNLLVHEAVWPIAKEGDYPAGAFIDGSAPSKIMCARINEFFVYEKGKFDENETGKALEIAECQYPGFVVFAHSSSGIVVNGKPYPSLIRLLKCIEYDVPVDGQKNVLRTINEAMFDKI